MINKKERTIDVYKQAGAEMRLFSELGGRLAIHISQVLSAPDTDKFMRALRRIDEVCSRADDNMFHDHPEISNEYMGVFYGAVSGKPRNAVDAEVIARAIIQLDEYFACKRTIFDVPLLAVGTEFQRTVWQELQNIPYGKTVSYGELSRKLGNPKAVRAVAAANGANALSILIPCHRVVGSNHTLIGYAGGLAAKQGMLALEADSCDGPSGSRIGQLF